MSISAEGSDIGFAGSDGISLTDSLGLGDEEGFPFNVMGAEGSESCADTFEEHPVTTSSTKRIENIRFMALP